MPFNIKFSGGDIKSAHFNDRVTIYMIINGTSSL